MIGHGMLTRFPRLKVVIVEHFNEWTRPMLRQFANAYERAAVLFDEDPLEVLRRNIWIHIFRDDKPLELISMLGVANSMFGSDFPHPEGLRDPLAFSEEIATLPIEDQELVMGGNLAPSHECSLTRSRMGRYLSTRPTTRTRGDCPPDQGNLSPWWKTVVSTLVADGSSRSCTKSTVMSFGVKSVGGDELSFADDPWTGVQTQAVHDRGSAQARHTHRTMR